MQPLKAAPASATAAAGAQLPKAAAAQPANAAPAAQFTKAPPAFLKSGMAAPQAPEAQFQASSGCGNSLVTYHLKGKTKTALTSYSGRSWRVVCNDELLLRKYDLQYPEKEKKQVPALRSLRLQIFLDLCLDLIANEDLDVEDLDREAPASRARKSTLSTKVWEAC